MADTPNLVLPYIQAAQAQKHVTHNEAIRLLDGMVQLAVVSRTLTAPPGSPVDGERYIVASGATGAWATWDLNVAFWIDGAWVRLIPRPGWIAYSVADADFYSWTGAAWATFGGGGVDCSNRSRIAPWSEILGTGAARSGDEHGDGGSKMTLYELHGRFPLFGVG